jgi:hypothetical protein
MLIFNYAVQDPLALLAITLAGAIAMSAWLFDNRMTASRSLAESSRAAKVLDALRNELRKRDYLPILFDSEKPRSRNTDETITLLARMARFVIADISDARAVLQELRAIVPDLPSLPVQAIILATHDFYRNRPSFLTVHRYSDQEQLLADLGDKVIRPAELKVLELRG